MFKSLVFLCVIISVTISCSNGKVNPDPELLKNEIIDIEKAFAERVSEIGMHKAFVEFADSNAVLMRNNTLIKGINAIDQAYKGIDIKGLQWTPDFVDVSLSGDMAYTYGQFILSRTDEQGLARQDTGIFHTVWKRQKDGGWKFVWD
ncbi:MAG: nuclear transport factor 2 family protein [Saprospiraceae bacterium]|nr:nuclear transport factor 2 family protein [Saprospiraceae bacterium]